MTNSRLVPLLAVAFLALACPAEDPDDNQPAPDAGPVGDVQEDTGTDAGDANDEQPPDYPLSRCDELDPEVCAFPWPSNQFLEPDDESPTDHRLTFDDETLPANAGGDHVSPDLFDHLDGYDLGVPIMVRFPDVDGSDLPDEYEIEASLDDDASILLYEITDQGLQRVPYWTELDQLEDDSEKRTLFVRPAVLLEPDTRYVVAFRDLTDTDGDPVQPPSAFSALVEGETEDDDVLEVRQQRFDEVFDLLDDHGIEPSSLTLAWDFVTASSEALHGPMLEIREQAADYAAETGIDWTTDSMTEFSDDDQADDHDPYIGLEIEATMEVPHFMEPYEGVDGAWQLHRDDEGDITRNETRDVPVYARIPHRALEDGDEIGVVVFGHGLLGSRHQIGAEHWGRAAQQMGVAFVAVDLVGMAHTEINVAEQSIADLNHFVGIADRLHQGLAEYLLLARTAPDALEDLEPTDGVDDPELSVDAADLHYAGGSQGGIFGGSFMALTRDVDRGYLSVPGNNYSTMLHRSTNFDEFNELMEMTYPESADRNINIALMNLLWSTTEPASFLRHVRAEPFDGDDPRDVFLAVAKGDYQVATITNENAARSDIEIPLLENYDEQREPFGAEVVDYPHSGSGTVLFDFGNPWPDPGNVPPDDDIGDPHGWLASVDGHFDQIETFFRDGEIVDICDGEPCQFDPPD